MSTYKELAEHLEAYLKNAHRMDEVIAILCSLDAQPVAEVSVMGSYHGKPILGCVLSNDSMQVGDKLYAVPVAAQPLELVGYFVFTGDTWERAAKEYESDADVVKL